MRVEAALTRRPEKPGVLGRAKGLEAVDRIDVADALAGARAGAKAVETLDCSEMWKAGDLLVELAGF